MFLVWKKPGLFLALLLVLAGGSYPPISFAGEVAEKVRTPSASEGTKNSLSADFTAERQKVRAPELEGHSGWLNTDEPLSIEGLRGKIVLLDFWTYGCVNCIHIIPDLKKLEAKYAKELVVIGVHSAKFDNEKDLDNIRNIVIRYGIEHPVVNDSEFLIWDSYAVGAWPTQVLIDPDGYIVARVSGEGKYDYFDTAIGALARDFRERGKLDEAPLERAKVGSLPLAFPGKVLADEPSNRLFISDSNHNRIVITDLAGKLVDVIGSGAASAKDGKYSEAGFDKPQGMALAGDDLYVADTGNHLIRRIDLKKKRVEPAAGTGSLEGFNGFGGKATETALRSPWDLEFAGGKLYIAMAGSHQIWRLDPGTSYIEPYAGTRWESRKDGAVKEAHFAQPSGLAAIGDRLFVADSESNIIREIDLEKGRVFTLAGGDLFKFGDVDGDGDYARLQHPLGVETYGEAVLVADTYNDKIKLLDPEKRMVSTFLGTGKEGQADGKEPSFYEPGGLSVAGGKLYIADTNNHAIRVADLKTKEVSTLTIDGLTPPDSVMRENAGGGAAASTVTEVSFTVGKKTDAVRARVELELPEGYHLNPMSPNRIGIAYADGSNPESPQFPVKQLPFEFLLDPEKLRKRSKVTFTAYYCREDNTGVCLIRRFVWVLSMKVAEDGKGVSELVLSAKTDTIN
ncbi:MAG: redoxin domain-containing protein [Acidobacteriota bacterium]|nr:MAG: redoxin domain-containing protein [Acidobacteriota bacterium]